MLQTLNTRKCTCCNQNLAESEFNVRQSRCKSCNKIKFSEWKLNNREQYLQKKRESYHRRKDTTRNSQLIRKFGVTLMQYNAMFEQQHGCCAICGKHQTEFKRRLSVDHDHLTGKVRQLLCYGCNTAIGFAREDPKILENMIQYLLKHKMGYAKGLHYD